MRFPVHMSPERATRLRMYSILARGPQTEGEREEILREGHRLLDEKLIELAPEPSWLR